MRQSEPSNAWEKGAWQPVFSAHTASATRDQEVLGTLERVEFLRKRRAGAEIRMDRKV